jgi:hypothetical protein
LLRLRKPVDHPRRRSVGLRDDVLQLLAGARRIDDQPDFLGGSLEVRIRKRIRQCSAHGRDPFG